MKICRTLLSASAEYVICVWFIHVLRCKGFVARADDKMPEPRHARSGVACADGVSVT